jgi:hypothetical protein
MMDDKRTWLDEAACRGMDVTLFEPTRRGDVPRAEAIATCQACPVTVECFLDTRADDPLYRAGMTREQRRRFKRKMREQARVTA